MTDKRNFLQKWLWDKLGPPLYYCEECLLGVSVTVVPDKEPVIKRGYGCECTGRIIAPRKVICVGKGGVSATTKLRIMINKLKADLTGRNA